MNKVIVYAVTAKHCLVSEETGLADSVVLLVNTREGGIGRIETEPSDWLLHSTADVAVLPINPDVGVFKFRAYPTKGAATGEFIEERKIGPGDDVCISGLLVHHPGRTQIMPIVRLGNIAALPQDPVNLTTGEDVVALLEVRSIGGLSGSPVFVHLPFWRDLSIPEGNIILSGGSVEASSGGDFHLLGVMHGFYPVGKNDPDDVSGGKEDLNTGIAVVAFVDRVLELINNPKEARRRGRVKEAIEKSQMPKPTTKADTEQEYDSFSELTRKLLKVPKTELDQKRQDES